MARFVTRGIEVSEETLALEAIARATPGSGFLSDEHTLKHWRAAQWAPSLLDRQQFGNWENAGSQDLYTRLNARALKILAEHKVPALSQEVHDVIADVLAKRVEK
jgi:trimethylamine--corrinoid protein Co-methyltransferase